MKKGKTIKNPILYRVLKPAAVFLFRIAYRPKIYGKENIPKSGAVVLAGNHKKFWDCFMVMAGTGRCVHFLAKSELFGNFFKCNAATRRILLSMMTKLMSDRYVREMVMISMREARKMQDKKEFEESSIVSGNIDKAIESIGVIVDRDTASKQK